MAMASSAPGDRSSLVPTSTSCYPRRSASSASQAVRAFAALAWGREDIVNYDRPVPPDESRRIARTFGVLYLITFATSIPALWLYQPVLDDPAGYIAGVGHDNKILLGAFLELLLIIANIGTAVVVYPLLKRVNEVCALGYVTARLVECTFILVGILTMVAVVDVAAQPVGRQWSDARVRSPTRSPRSRTGRSCFGPGFVVGIGNGLLLGYLMYRSKLVPKTHGDARARRRAADHHLRHRRDVRRRPAGRPAAGHHDHPRVHLGAVRSGSTRSSGASTRTHRSSPASAQVAGRSQGPPAIGAELGAADPQSTAVPQPQAAHSPRPASAASRSRAASSVACAVLGGIDSVRAYPADTSRAFTNRSGRPGRSR